MTTPPYPINPRSVKAAGGMRNFLDRLDIRVSHNGLGADDLLRLRDTEKEPWTLIMKKFGVRSRSTVKGWYKALKEEA